MHSLLFLLLLKDWALKALYCWKTDSKHRASCVNLILNEHDDDDDDDRLLTGMFIDKVVAKLNTITV